MNTASHFRNKTLKSWRYALPLAVLVSVQPLLTGTTLASQIDEASWNPVSSEKLVRLPTKYLDKYVEQDFRTSPLASNISSLELEIRSKRAKIEDLRSLLESVQGEERIEIRHQILEAKSAYLELIEQKQHLDQAALEKKRRIYESVLKKIRREGSRRRDPVNARLVASQQQARERMQQSMSLVNDMMSDLPGVKGSRYNEKYSINLAKIEQLKEAIAKHTANTGPVLDGDEVSREEFVRYLLSGIESELAILDQETLMVGYMSRLVALDAQELEQEIAFGIPGGPDGDGAQPAPSLADATDLFID